MWYMDMFLLVRICFLTHSAYWTEVNGSIRVHYSLLIIFWIRSIPENQTELVRCVSWNPF